MGRSDDELGPLQGLSGPTRGVGHGLSTPPPDRTDHMVARVVGQLHVGLRGHPLVHDQRQVPQALRLKEFEGGRDTQRMVLPAGKGPTEDRVVVLSGDSHPETDDGGGPPLVMAQLAVRRVAPIVRLLGDVVVAPVGSREFPRQARVSSCWRRSPRSSQVFSGVRWQRAESASSKSRALRSSARKFSHRGSGLARTQSGRR